MLGHFFHFIPHKGKGMLVLGLPLLVGVFLFLIFGATGLNDQYVLPASFLISAFFIWFFDGGPALLREGINNAQKSNHTLFWIEIKYWALVLGVSGCILLGGLLGK
jgi:hypothetical protein